MANANEAQLQNDYEKAKTLMGSIDCLKKNSDKAATLKRAAKRFEALGEYKDSADMASKCRAGAEKYSKTEDNLPPAPKNPADLKEPSKAFTWILRIIVLFVIVGILAFFYTRYFDHGAYLRSAFYEKIGNHEKAYKMFLRLKDYKDSEERYLDNRYKHGCEKLKDKDYEGAKKAFRAIPDYEDSGKKLVDAEIAIIKDTKVHGDVLFGEAHWIVAEKKKDKVFLIKTKPTNGLAYNTTDNKVTWKTCDLREFLNGSYMDDLFNKYMKDRIIKKKVVVKDNKKFGTKGSTTTDKLYLLNNDQFYKYEKDLNSFSGDYWLIGPGETQREAQFVSDCEVKEAGYPVNDRYINTRPCCWVSTK